MSDVIYEPKGRAKEYSLLACNLYTGCHYACAYCYAPSCLHMPRSTFHDDPGPRKNILNRLEADCRRMRGDPRDILLCFTCDPYQPDYAVEDVTREALLILERYDMRVQVLTKGGMRAMRDFDIFERNDWKFGSTLTYCGLKGPRWMKSMHEPRAPDWDDREAAIQIAHSKGIYTWVSLEPVIDPEESLEIIDRLRGFVDFWKVGRWNYDRKAKEIDWGKFLKDVRRALRGEKYLIKRGLLRVECDGEN